MFDDIEPVELKRKYDPPVSTSVTPPAPEVPASRQQNPDPLDVSSPSIFDEDAPFPEEPTTTRLVESPTLVASSTSSASPLAERLLGLARFADATGASASLAGMILNGPDSDRVELMPDLILHLIQEGRAGLAYHLSRSLEARAVRQRPFVPSWLIRTWTFGHSLVFPKGQIGGTAAR